MARIRSNGVGEFAMSIRALASRAPSTAADGALRSSSQLATAAQEPNDAAPCCAAGVAGAVSTTSLGTIEVTGGLAGSSAIHGRFRSSQVWLAPLTTGGTGS